MIQLAGMPIAYASTYNDFVYTLSDGEVTITGYNGLDEDVVVPSTINGAPVRTIGMYALSNKNSIKTLTIPDTVYTLESCSIYANSNLTRITLGSSIKTIGGDGIASNRSLVELELPDSVETIGGQAFYNCTSMRRVKLPENLTELPQQAFYSCKGIQNVEIPKGCTSIGDKCFSGCSSLQSVSLPNALTKIGDNAFENCTVLNGVVLPDGLTKIGKEAFKNCEALSKISFPEGLVEIGDSAFSGCKLITEINLPDNLEKLGASCFRNCLKLKSVKLPKEIDKLPAAVFEGTGFTKIDFLPDSLEEVGNCAFRNCDSLVSVMFPDSVEKFGYGVCMECDALDNVNFPENINKLPQSFFMGCRKADMSYLPETIVEIGDYAYSETPITDLVIPDRITKIGKGAFEKCMSLRTVDTGPGITELPENAFYQCKTLETVELCDSIKKIGNSAFEECYNLINIRFPKSLTYIGEKCFQSCTKLKNVDLENTVLKEIGGYCFFECKVLESITLPSTLSKVHEKCFEACYKLESIELPDQITRLPEYMFWNCKSLKGVKFPTKLTTIANYAFEYCSALEKVEFPDALSFVGNYSFRNCTSLKSVKCPETTTTIAKEAFLSCTSLEEIYILNPSVKITAHAIGYKPYLLGYEKANPDLKIYGYYQSNAEKYAADNKFTFCELNSNPPGVQTVITLDAEEFNLAQYHKRQIKFEVENPGGSTKFESSNPEIATVDKDGIVEGISEGTAYIVVVNANSTIVVTVNVMPFDIDIKNEHQNSEYKYYVDEDFKGDFSIRITGYIGAGGKVEIPSTIDDFPVKVIDYQAFWNNPDITEIIIPEGVEKLGAGAISYCSNLRSIKFPCTITHCDALPFGDYYESNMKIERIEFPSVRAMIKLCALVDNPLDCALPNQNPYTLVIGGNEVSEIEIPQNTKQIPDNAFKNCQNIKKVILNEGLEEIGECAFLNCNSLESINISDSVKLIDSAAFYGCAKLNTINLPDNLEKLGSSAFCDTAITEIRISKTAELSGKALANCPKLETVYFAAAKLPELYKGMFKNCSSVKRIYFDIDTPDFTAEIFDEMNASPTIYGYAGSSAEKAAKEKGFNFVTIELPTEPVTEPVTEPLETEPLLPEIPMYPDYFYDESTLTYTVTDKQGANKGEDAYPNEQAWFGQTVIFDFEEEVRLTDLCTQWFYSVEKIVVKGNVREIGKMAFGHALKEVEISDNVKAIADDAFAGCANLTEIPSGKGLLKIGKGAFMNCSGLKYITIPETVTEIVRKPSQAARVLKR